MNDTVESCRSIVSAAGHHFALVIHRYEAIAHIVPDGKGNKSLCGVQVSIATTVADRRFCYKCLKALQKIREGSC